MFSYEVYLKAFTYAVEAHADQKTPKGLPYLVHFSGVASLVIEGCKQSQLDEEKSNLAIVCALLHDVIEDTSKTYDDLYTQFSPEVADGVEALTKDKTLPSKKEQMQNSLEKLMNQPYEVQMVKLADRITNLSTPPSHWNKDKINAYYNEAKLILSCIRNSNMYLSSKLEEKIKEYEQYL